MSRQILVIGCGFAGMWAALSAARQVELQQGQDVSVTVLAPQPALRVRPRFYEEHPADCSAPLDALFSATGVNFLRGNATRVDAAAREVHYLKDSGESCVVSYDKLVLASGSQLNRNNISGADAFAFDIDQAESAEKFNAHLRSLAAVPASAARNTVVVCGGGLTGIELAMELPARLAKIFTDGATPRVMVIERAAQIGGHFGQELRDVIAQASNELNVEWRLNSSIETIQQNGVTLTDGTFIESHSVVLTAGVSASPLTLQIEAPRDNRGRLHVDANLQVIGQPDIFATGDVAYAACDNEGHHAFMTCQHAIPLGKYAGNNAAAALLNAEPLAYQQPFYVTCVDLGPWGAVYTETWAQEVKMVKEEAKKLKTAITNELIYPPVADKEKAFTLADPLAPFV
ncbi:FAD-dependent oxidoreductase [Atlantibacter sp.]|uniref:NAD(P)/FAD-dependent oxidoreductase n=1 Tax=Atlantibacter sp. TaxID=1903473 RepID=UPI0028B085C1|nr:FAD-dependent oxidoreductase [Atlantibacter sp.]